MFAPEVLDRNRKRGVELLDRFRLLQSLRPSVLGSVLLKLLGPDDRRGVIAASNGLRVYADPFTHLGRSILGQGTFEPETEAVFRANLSPGGIFLDIGANEGYFSSLAGTIVGAHGMVIAIEPQSRLQDIIELNLRINGVENYRVYRNIFGGQEGAERRINLWPTQNTGASSMMHQYRFYRKTEPVRFVSLERIFNECGLDHVDLVKVDVEGFEGQVVHHMLPHLRQRQIRSLFLDYHRAILEEAHIDPRSIHEQLVQCGYRVVLGDESRLDSYLLYQPLAP